jgi:hypothetical protein
VSVSYKKKKPDALSVSQVWLQIYSVILSALENTPNKESIAANAANAIVKEIDLGD